MNQYEMKQKAYQSTLKSRALQVLVYLIDRSNKEGTCFPAISTMSRELHISVSTVKRALRELTESGVIKKESRYREKNQGQTSNLYTVSFLEDNEETEKECKIKANNKADTNILNVESRQAGIVRGGKSLAVLGSVPGFIRFDFRTLNYFLIRITYAYYDFCMIYQRPGEEVKLIPP